MSVEPKRNVKICGCGKIAKTAMENTAASDSANRMTNVNILEKLKQELVTPEKMKEFVSQVVKMAKPCVQFNPTETADGVKMMKMIPMSIIIRCAPVALANPVNSQNCFRLSTIFSIRQELQRWLLQELNLPS